MKKHPSIAAEVGWLGALYVMWTGLILLVNLFRVPDSGLPVTLGYVAANSCVAGHAYYVDALSCPKDKSALAFTILIWLLRECASLFSILFVILPHPEP